MPRAEIDSWYNHPEWVDIAFQEDTQREAGFIEHACEHYCDFQVERLLEPACGTGRLVVALAERGFEVTGFDINEPSLKYLRKILARKKLPGAALTADMAEFSLAELGAKKPFDAAYCPFNSFRHLLSEDAARRHLESVAAAIRPGGIYILGFHLLPPDADDTALERWKETRGDRRVNVTLRVDGCDRRRRIERFHISLVGRKNEVEVVRVKDEFDLRVYTAAQAKRLLKSVPAFELVDVFDFWYDHREPLRLDDSLEDVVLVLKKKVGTLVADRAKS